MMETDFRHALREQTRTDHDFLDRMISTLDIARLRDFRVFLQIHHSCFLVMQARSLGQGLSTAALSNMIDGLAADLDAVTANPYAIDLPTPSALDPLSIDYMVAGSRLGSKILSKRWGASTDPCVQRANTYFGQAIDPKLWPETCRALSALPPSSARADAIVEDTRTQFQLFAAAFAKIVTAEDALV
ncbi:biliverdin-producing heme oxygenase [Yoonia sp. SDW83-1]|uniref:biliverdin-producing heme oxygenase n=1 Tax=Yoonia sp. SDW83-1 TaxID=3366945 RepID=UPI00398C7096